jgi:predicted  nucleic acid-binding Zn-ribbon protein
MQELVLDGQTFTVQRRTLVYNCELFADNPVLQTQPYAVQARVSPDSFRIFVNAIGTSEAEITDSNAKDLRLLCDEFKFTTLLQEVTEWQAAHPEAVVDPSGCRIDDGMIRRLVEEKVECLHATLGCSISSLRERIEGGKSDINEVKTSSAQQARELCVLDGEVCRLVQAVSELAKTQAQQYSELSASAVELRKKAHHERSKFSSVKEAVERLEREDEKGRVRVDEVEQLVRQLQASIESLRGQVTEAESWQANAGPGIRDALGKVQSENDRLTSELSKSQRREEDLGSRVQQLEQTIRQLHESNDALQKRLGSVESGQERVTALQSDVACLKEAIQSMSQRTGSAPPSPPKPVTRAGKQFPPSMVKGSRWELPNGIISHLTKQCGGNVHQRGIVVVTGSEALTSGDDYAPLNVVNFESGDAFITQGTEPSDNIGHNWMCYDFKDRRVIPTHYTIRSHNDPKDKEHLKTWVVETSADGGIWRQIDSKTNNSDLNGFRNTRTFAVSASDPCRFIRLVNKGRNHKGDFRLQVEAWEIFGTLID